MNFAYLTRRRFLKTAARSFAWGFGSMLWTPAILGVRQDAESAKELAANLLQLVNAERSVAGVQTLKSDDLASQVATAHALEMATGKFLSHWGRDGRKPYHRYSFAGGVHATQENLASVDNFESWDWKGIANDLLNSHRRMHAETPPNDGHRKAMLAPQHTHVGFGFAVNERRLRLVEMYVAKYVELADFNSRAKRKASFDLSGKLLNRKHTLQQADIFYEPLPKPPDERFWRVARSYGLPDEYRTIRPRLPEGVLYSDRIPGLVELDSKGRFRVPIKLFKDSPGIYTIVFWIKRARQEKAFPATEICIESD